MSTLRITVWTLIGVLVAALVFLAATIRVVESPASGEAQARVAVQPGSASGAVAPAPTIAGEGPIMAMPVQGVDISTLRSNWGDARGGGTRAHQGLDIMAPGGTPVLAATDGTVEKLYYSAGGGGITLYERTNDGRWMLYYAHLGGYAPGMREGQRVRAGETLGYVGDTGNAGAGNHHLHFGVAMMAPGERWHQGTPVDPYPLLAGTLAAR